MFIITDLQIYGDSLLVIQWLKGEYEMRNFILQSLLDEINGILPVFNDISFHHVYRERNQIAEFTMVIAKMPEFTIFNNISFHHV